MGTVCDILRTKGCMVYCVSSAATLKTAAQHMVLHNVGALLVMDDESIQGIVTERDLMRMMARIKEGFMQTPVSMAMSTQLVCVEPSATLEACMDLMTRHRCRHLPVMDKDQLMGLISIGDVLKNLTHDREVHIQVLSSYISQPYPG